MGCIWGFYSVYDIVHLSLTVTLQQSEELEAWSYTLKADATRVHSSVESTSGRNGLTAAKRI